MKRLSLAELKAQSGNVVANLEAIKGGNLDNCHNAAPSVIPPPPGAPDPKTEVILKKINF